VKVKCKFRYPDEDTLDILGDHFYRKQSFGVSPEKEYLVLGLLIAPMRPFGTMPWVFIHDDDDNLSQAPIGMFDIVDPRASHYWEVRVWSKKYVTIAPPPISRTI
jgi:hypothetical protein